ncbi:hypothetical protein HT105_23055, partial [Bacteroides fragilis]|nr:hypothetical protein [Bacteroides fragilis]
AGASFGGLAAARTVRRRPDLVENAIVQSASFWFDPEELAAWQKPLAGPPRRIFHEIGTLETALSSSTPTKKDSMGSVNQEFAGASFGGLAAARTVRRRPDLVENAIVQSASFW